MPINEQGWEDLDWLWSQQTGKNSGSQNLANHSWEATGPPTWFQSHRAAAVGTTEPWSLPREAAVQPTPRGHRDNGKMQQTLHICTPV